MIALKPGGGVVALVLVVDDDVDPAIRLSSRD
jgi:hypothetical protein